MTQQQDVTVEVLNNEITLETTTHEITLNIVATGPTGATGATGPQGPPGSGGGGAVDSVNGQTGVVVLDQDDVADGNTYKQYSATEKTKLAGIEAGAEVNNMSDANATDLTDAGDSSLHYHLSDRDVKPRLTGGVAYRQTQLDSWFSALLAATSASPIDVVYIGDSINALGTTSIPNPPGYFEKYINQSLGVSETTDVPIGVYAQADYSPTATSTQGTVTATALGGFGSALSNTQVLTHVATCVGFSVAYRTAPGNGTITIRDGAGGTILATIDTNAAAKSGNVWHSGALSNGSHTLHITSTGNTVVEMIHPNYGHKVRVWNCAHAGYKSADYTTNAYLALELIDTLQAAGTLKLVVIATGANDNGGSGYATDIPALIAAVDARTTADMALWFPYISGALPLSEYTAARTAAYATGLPVIDASVVAANSLGIDGTHPDTWQKRMLGLHQAAFLGGDPFGILVRQLHDPSRAGIIIPSLGGSGPEISNISGLLAAFFGAPGPGWTIGDGTTAFGDTTIARKSAARLSVNNGAGTIEGGLSPAINAQTGTTYTLVLADAGKMITRSNGSASTQTLPQNSDAAIPVGSIIHIVNLGAGVVTFAAGSGATIAGSASIKQNQRAVMIKIATNTWNISAVEVTLTGTETLTNKTLTEPTLTLKQSASPAPTAEGDIQWDTDDNVILIGTGGSTKEVVNTDNPQTLSSKTLTSPVINTSVSGSALDTDYLLAANSDTLLASQKAIKAHVYARTIVIQPTSGDYYGMGGLTAAASPGLTIAGKIIFHPIWLAAGTIDRIAVSTSVAAVSTYRLGLYKADPTTGLVDGMVPFLDAGTVDMNATAGVQAITISQAITEPGLYWAAILVDAYTAQPTCHCVIYSSSSGNGILGLPQDMSSLGRYRVARVYGSTVATGSLPTAPTSSMTWAGTAPRLAVRYA